MSEQTKRAVAVPRSRISRLGRLGSLAGRVAGNMLIDGGKQLARGQRPAARDLLLTPSNMQQLANKLATMRGAAMKVGQLLSMDTGNLLPAELTAILERLREDAVIMPAVQLHDALERNWGENWSDNFVRFSFEPIAAASIGQVHRAMSRNEQDMAVKIQYPGVKESIDSDLDNVFGLLRLSGLIPKELDLNPLIDEARSQLKREADYALEGASIEEYYAALSTSALKDRFLMPRFFSDYSTPEILCMSYVEGVSLDALQSAPQAVRDRCVADLFELLLMEFTQFGFVQTDPNLANYQYSTAEDKVVLLDFGANRAFERPFVERYCRAIRAAIEQQSDTLAQALSDLGFFAQNRQQSNLPLVLDIFMMAMEPLRSDGVYDFGATDLAQRIHQKGLEISSNPDAWHTPPPDVLFLHRKLAGLYLIATRFKARVDVAAIAQRYLF